MSSLSSPRTIVSSHGRKCTAFLHCVLAASGAARCRRCRAFLQEAAMVAVRTMEEKMRVISQSELLRLSRLELTALPALPEGSHELRIARLQPL